MVPAGVDAKYKYSRVIAIDIQWTQRCAQDKAGCYILYYIVAILDGDCSPVSVKECAQEWG